MDSRQYDGSAAPEQSAPKTTIELPVWWEQLDTREAAQIQHAVDYAEHYKHAGAPGHGQFILIAKLYRQLEAAEQRAHAAQGRVVVQKVSWSSNQETGEGCWRDLITGVRVNVP